jgi:hypothetical protein
VEGERQRDMSEILETSSEIGWRQKNGSKDGSETGIR